MPGLRFRSAVNWLLLSVNIVLLIFLASRWLLPADKATAQARKYATTLGMDIYVVKDPFILVVDKNFPRDRSFALLVDEQMLSITLADATAQGDAEAKREVTVGLGSEFAIACDYSVMKEAPWVRVEKIVLSKEEEQGLNVGLMDLNADGFYDLRIRHKAQQTFPTQIWYGGEWRDVLDDDASQGGGLYKKQLRDVGEVIFDLESGHWLSSGDGPPREPE